MPRYTAALSALMTITASSTGQAESNACDDAREFLSQNSHGLEEIYETPGAELTTSAEGLQFSASCEHEFPEDGESDDDDGDSVEDNATATFDVTFDAPDIGTAAIIALGLPKRLCAMDEVAAILRETGEGGQVHADQWGTHLTVTISWEARDRFLSKVVQLTDHFESYRERPEDGAVAVEMALSLDDTIACTIARAIATSDPELAKHASGGLHLTASGSREGSFSVTATAGSPTATTATALQALIAAALGRAPRKTTYGVTCELGRRISSSTLAAAHAKDWAMASVKNLAAAIPVAAAYGAKMDAGALDAQIPHRALLDEAA